MADDKKKTVRTQEDKEFLLSKTAYVLPDNPSDKQFSASQIRLKLYEGFLVLFDWLVEDEEASEEGYEEILELLESKLDKVDTHSVIYATDNEGNQVAINYSVDALADLFPIRNTIGEIYVPRNTTNDDAAISYHQFYERTEELDEKFDEYLALAGGTMTGDIKLGTGASILSDAGKQVIKASNGKIEIGNTAEDIEISAHSIVTKNIILQYYNGSTTVGYALSTDVTAERNRAMAEEQAIRELAAGKTKSITISIDDNPSFDTEEDPLIYSGTIKDIHGNTYQVSNLNNGDEILIAEHGYKDRWYAGSNTFIILEADTSFLTNYQLKLIVGNNISINADNKTINAILEFSRIEGDWDDNDSLVEAFAVKQDKETSYNFNDDDTRTVFYQQGQPQRAPTGALWMWKDAGGDFVWGGIGGDIEDQTDLINFVNESITEEFEDKTDLLMVKNLSLSILGDIANFTVVTRNIYRKTDNSNVIPLPVANATTAGLMSYESYNKLLDHDSKIERLEGRIKRLLYTASSNPSPSDINNFVISQGYVTDDFPYLSVIVSATKHKWSYYSSPTPQWADDGIDVVEAFSDGVAGIIKGATGTEGKIKAEVDGTGSVIGWDTLIARLDSDESDIDSKYDKSGGTITGKVNLSSTSGLTTNETFNLIKIIDEDVYEWANADSDNTVKYNSFVFIGSERPKYSVDGTNPVEFALKSEAGTSVSVSTTGTSTRVAKYISIDDEEWKLGGGSGGDVNVNVPLYIDADEILNLGYDNSSLGVNSSNKLEVKDGGITNAKIANYTISKVKIDPNARVTYLNDTQTLTSKTIDAENNDILNLTVDNFKEGVIVDAVDDESTDEQIATAKVVYAGLLGKQSIVTEELTGQTRNLLKGLINGVGVKSIGAVKFAISDTPPEGLAATVYSVTIYKSNSLNGCTIVAYNPYSKKTFVSYNLATGVWSDWVKISDAVDLAGKVNASTENNILYGNNGSGEQQVMYIEGLSLSPLKMGYIPTVGAILPSINSINAKIDSSASSTDKLIPESKIDEKIESVEARQLYKTATQGSFATKAELTAATTFYDASGSSTTPTKNDVVYVLVDETHDGKLAKYTCAAVSPLTWGFVIALSDVTFTQARLDAIDSGITATKLSNLQNNKLDKTDEYFQVYGTASDGTQTTYDLQLELLGVTGAIPTSYAVKGALNLKEDLSNKVTSLSSSSTDTQYPSAKVVYDSLSDKVSKTSNYNALYGTDSSARETTYRVNKTSITELSTDVPSSQLVTLALNGKVPTTRKVNGKALSADITLAKADVGLGNVDNTSDANKPISTATQTALNAKQNTITGAASSAVSSNFTTNRVVGTNNSGKLAVCNATATEVNYLSGVTSNVQTQLNAKQNNPTITPINITELDTTKFVLGENRSCLIEYPTYKMYCYYFRLTSQQAVTGSATAYVNFGDVIQADITVSGISGHLPFTVSCNNGTYPTVGCEFIDRDLTSLRLYIPNGLANGSVVAFSANFIVKK